MRLALILVHYRTPELLAPALDALRSATAGLAAAGAEVETIVVDNGNDAEGRAVIAGLGVTVIEPGRNLGFAGGVNAGVERSRAERLVILNPDVVVAPDCLRHLLAELDRGAAIVGPLFFWDEAWRVMLPPTERVGRLEELRRVFAERGAAAAARVRRRWRAHARRHWRATQPIASSALSGGLLAFRRDTWERVGAFDTGYALYFEETDWLTRARARRVVCRFVPAARALHLHGESARREPRAEAWFEEGAARFRHRHYGAWFERLRRRVGAPVPAASPALPAGTGTLEIAAHRGRELWIEISPRAVGFPAAAERLTAPWPATWSLPNDVRSRMRGGPWTLRVVDEAGREFAAATVAGAG